MLHLVPSWGSSKIASKRCRKTSCSTSYFLDDVSGEGLILMIRRIRELLGYLHFSRVAQARASFLINVVLTQLFRHLIFQGCLRWNRNLEEFRNPSRTMLARMSHPKRVFLIISIRPYWNTAGHDVVRMSQAQLPFWNFFEHNGKRGCFPPIAAFAGACCRFRMLASARL